MSPAEKEIRALEQQWRTARVEGDTKFLELFYAPDLKIQTASGDVVTRQADIDLFATRAIKPEFIRAEELTVRVYGDTAVVTGLDHLRGTYRGQPGDMYLRFTDVLVRRGGRWQLVAHQSTTFKKPAP